MSQLLFVAHRIPYPPDKGDKIRNYHVIRALAERFDVHLLAFYDTPVEAAPSVLADLCASVSLFPLPGRGISLVRGLARGTSVSEAHFVRPAARRRVAELVSAHGITTAMVSSSALLPYLEGFSGRRFVDFMDVDSDKWRQFAGRSRSPLHRFIYGREADKVAALERRALDLADGVFVVAEREKTLLSGLFGASPKVTVAGNGVALPPEKAEDGGENVIFMGAMDYWPNVDAVTWFAREVWPTVHRARPGSIFWVVGSNPSATVRELQSLPGCEVTGTVNDVVPYLLRARVMVAPLRVARGVQNKVLEGMAAGLAVVTTPEGADGVDAENGGEFVVAADARALGEAVIDLLQHPDKAHRMGGRARALMADRFDWVGCLAPLVDAVSGDSR